MNFERLLSSVVLPLPVPPLIMMLIRPSMAASSSCSISGQTEPRTSRSATCSGRWPKRRIESTGPSQGQRRNDRVHAAAVGQAGIDHRRMLVDAAADAGDDPLNDLQQVLVVGEDGVRLLQPAEPFDVDLVRAVDQDVADVRVLHVRLERAEAERFGDQLVDQALLVDRPAACASGVRSMPSARWRMSSRSSSSERPVIRERSSESSSSR